METKASSKYIRISPRKARLVVDSVRGRDVADAQQILDYSPKAAARVVAKILNSAIANAEHNNGLDPDDLYVSRAYVDEGPTLKRFRPRAMGRATRINKRTSHITLVLDEREPRPESKRRRFRRPVRKKATAEPQAPQQDEAPEAQQDEDNEVELNAETMAEEDANEELDTEEAPEADAPEAPRADSDQDELNAETEVDENVDEERDTDDSEADQDVKDTKSKREPEDKKTKARKTKKADDSESED